MTQDKVILRAQMRAGRASIDAKSSLSEALIGRLSLWLSTRTFRTVFCYLSTAEEVSTWKLVAALLGNKYITLCCPKVLNRQTMIAVRLDSLDSLSQGPMGIYTPNDDQEFKQPIDLAIVPGLAFTPAGVRLGYGGGYYDRWFSEHPDTHRAAICFESQIVRTLPQEPHDVAMNLIFTDKTTYYCDA